MSAFNSIAVLPAESIGSDPDHDYLADAMTDALITRLGQIKNLKVIAKTSVSLYKNESKTSAEIGEELGVTALVETSVLSTGDSLRITANLVEAATGSILWTDSYTRAFREVLALQNQVAYVIASKIQVAMSPDEEKRLKEKSVVDPESV